MIPWNIKIAITNLTGYGSSMGFIKGGWKIEHDTYRIPRNYFKPTTKHQQNINPKVGSCRRDSTVLFRRLIASFPSMLCLSPASKCRQQCHRKLDMRRIAGLLSLDGRLCMFNFFPLDHGEPTMWTIHPKEVKNLKLNGIWATKQVKFIGMWRGREGKLEDARRGFGLMGTLYLLS